VGWCWCRIGRVLWGYFWDLDGCLFGCVVVGYCFVVDFGEVQFVGVVGCDFVGFDEDVDWVGFEFVGGVYLFFGFVLVVEVIDL